MRKNALRGYAVGAFLALLCCVSVRSADAKADRPSPLPSWNDTEARRAIVSFVERAVRPGDDGFIPPPLRVAAFDNDGTLWSEQPMYVQMHFVLDRIAALAPRHPEWRENEPFASVLRGDMDRVWAGGAKAVFPLIMAAQAEMTGEEFLSIAGEWLSRARHPETGRRFVDMVYQPMLEAMEYLRANGFKVYIVTGGGADFVRAFSEEVYGVPPENVIGSSLATRWEDGEEGPRLLRAAKVESITDGEAKPAAIQRALGRRPAMAFGNSDGDLQMLRWTMTGDGPRFALVVHHTDGGREWAYDRGSRFGRLDKALDVARSEGWAIVDMARDWRTIFRPDR